ncbi:DUF1430 domain-containing protein [Priestia megaterium]|uniref:DUF1430 domain-containing protein n=1 Tax=Priestia megaterium TaxID=1404 RepID=UPI002A6ACC12|nr:DUF1430 domain-containing protein [Priestia megaterium]MDY0943233.1 DUF1430 domain-containing protein [Priestia megaterium]
MKKILIGLVLVAYGISSFMFIKYYEVKEMIDINSSNKVSLSVVEWSKNERPEDKLNKIEEISRKEKVNIYKVVYKPIETSQKQKIILYTAISDVNKFKKEFPLKSGKMFTEKDSKDLYLSSLNEKNSEQIGRIDLFSPSNIIEIRPLKAAKNENLRGTYLVDSEKPKVIEKIKDELKTKVGFKIKNQKQLNIINTLADQGFSKYLIIVLVIIFILISLSFLYYILLNYKELAIKKMFGYSDRELIFKHLMKENVLIHAIALGIVIIFQVIYLFFYNRMSRFLDFSSGWVVWQLVFTFVSILFGLAPFLMVYHIKIAEMLKNKKPLKLVQFLNYSSKLIFSIILVILFINFFNNYQEFTAQNSNYEKWNTTKNYSFYEIRDTSTGDRDIWAYEVGVKSKKLFNLASEKGAMLVKPSDSIVYKEFIESEQSIPVREKGNEYDPEEGNTIQVNPNYLRNNPVYGLNGEKIKLKENFGDNLIVLVPEKYRDFEKDIFKRYKEWYQFKRFIDEDTYYKNTGKKVKPHKEVEVKLVFIKNRQKHFLYNPNLEIENQNYVKDSLLVVVNSQNMGGDSYLNYLSAGYFFPHINDSSNPYKELKNDIKLADLQDTILTTPLLYSVVDGYMFNLQNEIKMNLFLSILLLSIEIIITIFMVLNYLERNKLIHSVQKINGFSFFKRHNKFFSMVSLFWLIICLGLLAIGISTVTMTLFIVLAFLVFEWILVYTIIKFTEKKKTKDVLKGA